jgi:hypothetical protein
MAQADSAPALGMPPDRVEPPASSGDPDASFLPPPLISHELRIRLYSVCPDGTRHTDPELLHIEGSYL